MKSFAPSLSPPAAAAALPPAACGVGAWLLVHRCCVQLGRPWLGAGLVLLAAGSPLVLLHVNDSEVWGPHLLLSALFIHTVFATRARPRPFLLGLLLGLALSQHLTAVLLVPLAIAAALPSQDGDGSYLDRTVGNGLRGVAGSLVGLLPYASLAIGRGGGWRWGQTETLEGLVAHVLRRDFGTFSLSLHEEEVALTDSLGRALASFGEVWSGGLAEAPPGGERLLAVAIGLGTLALALVGMGLWVAAQPGEAQADARDPDRDEAVSTPVPARVALGLGLSLLASAALFPAIGNIDPNSSFGAWILERFDLLTVLLAVLPLCLALGWVGEGLGRALADRRWIAPLGGGAILVALLAAQLAAVLERGRPATERAVEFAALDLVSTPDPAGPAIPGGADGPVRAIVFGTDDHRSFPVLYVQEVLGAGAHTLYVDAELLAYPWYRARLRARLPQLPEVDKPLRMMGAIWSDPELREVPIYLANVFSRPAAKLERVPEGMLWRVPPPPNMPSYHAEQWTHAQILARHLAACERMRVRPQDFGGREHPRGHPWSADLWFAYVEKARLLARVLPTAGLADELPAVAAALEAHTGATLP